MWLVCFVSIYLCVNTTLIKYDTNIVSGISYLETVQWIRQRWRHRWFKDDVRVVSFDAVSDPLADCRRCAAIATCHVLWCLRCRITHRTRKKHHWLRYLVSRPRARVPWRTCGDSGGQSARPARRLIRRCSRTITAQSARRRLNYPTQLPRTHASREPRSFFVGAAATYTTKNYLTLRRLTTTKKDRRTDGRTGGRCSRVELSTNRRARGRKLPTDRRSTSRILISEIALIGHFGDVGSIRNRRGGGGAGRRENSQWAARPARGDGRPCSGGGRQCDCVQFRWPNARFLWLHSPSDRRRRRTSCCIHLSPAVACLVLSCRSADVKLASAAEWRHMWWGLASQSTVMRR